MARLGRFVVRRRKLILVAALLFVLASGVLGAGAVAHLKVAGFTDPTAESTKAQTVLKNEFNVQDPSLAVLIGARAGTVDSPQVAVEGRAIASRLAQEAGVVQVQS